MANKITLNETSYFGKGAIQEIVTEVKTVVVTMLRSLPTRI